MSLGHRVRWSVLGATGIVTAVFAATVAPPSAVAAPASPLYPQVGAGTQFLDHASYLAGFDEPAWYEANIPFVDLPDADDRRTSTTTAGASTRRRCKYTGPEDGWIVSEFLGRSATRRRTGASTPPPGHHIYEGRWLRDHRYLDDYLDYWLRGTGAGPKPATDELNENTTDWAHQYSFWAADAA